MSAWALIWIALAVKVAIVSAFFAGVEFGATQTEAALRGAWEEPNRFNDELLEVPTCLRAVKGSE